MSQLTFNDTLIATFEAMYGVANSASMLYSSLRADYNISSTISKYDTNDLIETFNALGKDVKNSSDLSLLYAIEVALTFKPYEEVESFFKNLSKMEYGWFGKIARIHLEKNTQPIITLS